MLDALRTNDFRGFAAAFDIVAMKRSLDLFAPHRPTLDDWLEDLLSGFGSPQLPRHHRPGIHFTPRGPELRWTWPDVRITDLCRVTVGDDADEPLYERSLSRRDYERAGGRVLLPIERIWAGAHVTVHAELDAGFAIFLSPPLELGQLGRAKASYK
jgi:hypothetical protein